MHSQFRSDAFDRRYRKIVLILLLLAWLFINESVCCSHVIVVHLIDLKVLLLHVYLHVLQESREHVNVSRNSIKSLEQKILFIGVDA